MYDFKKWAGLTPMCVYSRTSIIWLGSFLFRKWACLSNAHAHSSCYHGDMPAYLLRMHRQPCGTAVYQ